MKNEKIEIAEEVMGIEILSHIFKGNLYFIKKKNFKKSINEILKEIIEKKKDL